MKAKKLIDMIIKTGLNTYKYRNSKASLPSLVQAAKQDKLHKKGAIFLVRSKGHFTDKGVKGYVVTSKETLFEDYNKVTHWTPNTYGVFGYTDEEKRYIRGFEESHLNQINTFVFDVDTKKHTVQDILLTCLDNSLGSPTAIVESERGYQVYFVLSEPMFMTNKADSKIHVIAKRISDNLKRSLTSIDVDMYCNDFGFFRIPNDNNLVWFNETAVYSIGELITYSQRQDDNQGRSLYVVPKRMTISNVLETEWFKALVNATDVKGEKGQLGRNNLLFTLALVCLQNGNDEEFTFELIEKVNNNFKHTLKANQLKIIVKSAFSGKYKGAKKEYVEYLIQTYVNNEVEIKMGCGGWYKHKKDRSDRKRSHYDEWEQDIINYIEVNAKQGFINTTQKELCNALNIPQSTLNEVLSNSKSILKRVKGRGKGSKTFLTTVGVFIRFALEKTRKSKMASSKGLRAFVNQFTFEVSAATKKLEVYLNQIDREIIKDSDKAFNLWGSSG